MAEAIVAIRARGYRRFTRSFRPFRNTSSLKYTPGVSGQFVPVQLEREKASSWRGLSTSNRQDSPVRVCVRFLFQSIDDKLSIEKFPQPGPAGSETTQRERAMKVRCHLNTLLLLALLAASPAADGQ